MKGAEDFEAETKSRGEEPPHAKRPRPVTTDIAIGGSCTESLSETYVNERS